MCQKSDFPDTVLEMPVSSVVRGILALSTTSTHSPGSSLLQSLVTSLLCPVSGMMVAMKLGGTQGFSLPLRAVQLLLEETQPTLSSLGRSQSIVIRDV